MAEQERKGFEIPADAVQIGAHSYMQVPEHLIQPGESKKEAALRLLAETITEAGWTLPPGQLER